MKKFFLAIISIALSLFIGGLVSAFTLPFVDSISTNLSPGSRDLIGTVTALGLLALLIALPFIWYSWLTKNLKTESSDQKPEPANNQTIKTPIPAFVTLALLCLVVIGYGLTASENTVTDFAYLLGSNAVSALVLFALFTLAFGKFLSGPAKGGSFVAILAALMVSSFIAAERNQEIERAAIARMEDNALRIAERLSNPDSSLEPIVTNTSPESSNSATQRLENWFNGYLNQLAKNQIDYQAELEAINFFNYLNGERIRNDSDLSDSNYMANRAREIVDKYQQLHVQTLDSVPSSLDVFELSPEQKASFLATFEASKESGLERANEIWRLERAIISKSEELVKFLSNSEASWTWDGEFFLFDNNKGVEIFNSLFDELQAMIDSQITISQESTAAIQRSFDIN